MKIRVLLNKFCKILEHNLGYFNFYPIYLIILVSNYPVLSFPLYIVSSVNKLIKRENTFLK